MNTIEVTNRELKNYDIDTSGELYPSDKRIAKLYVLKEKEDGQWTIIGSKPKPPKDRKEYYREWTKKNPGKSKEYYLNRKEKGLAGYDPEYYKKAKDIYKDAQYRWFENNKEHWNEYQRDYYIKNKERILEQQRQYRERKKLEELEYEIKKDLIIKDGTHYYDPETKKYKPLEEFKIKNN